MNISYYHCPYYHLFRHTTSLKLCERRDHAHLSTGSQALGIMLDTESFSPNLRAQVLPPARRPRSTVVRDHPQPAGVQSPFVVSRPSRAQAAYVPGAVITKLALVSAPHPWKAQRKQWNYHHQPSFLASLWTGRAGERLCWTWLDNTIFLDWGNVYQQG